MKVNHILGVARTASRDDLIQDLGIQNMKRVFNDAIELVKESYDLGNSFKKLDERVI